MRRIDKRPVIFLHIPKTAGTTLHRIIERQYVPEHIISFGPDAHQSIADFKALREARRAQIRMLKGHMAFGLHRYFPADSGRQRPVYFTLLRDPIERVISHYYHVLRDPTHYLYPYTEAGRMGLADFLKSKAPVMLNNGQTRLISGIWEKTPFGACDAEMLETAKRNIREHFVLVGLTERFDETLCLLRTLLGWHNDISYVPRNVGDNRPQRDRVSPETLAAITEFNQLDIALYAYAEQLFEEKVQQSHNLALQMEALHAQNRLKALHDEADIMMRDYEVISDVPMIGQWIVEARQNLTSHLREPYIDPTFERQIEFNHRVLQEMQALARMQDKLLRRIEELEKGTKTEEKDE
ncbi:MAG: sulfotransferase family 2 domain-containing protein [Anaerolineales bacterium]